MGRAKPKPEPPRITSKLTAKNQLPVPPEVREKLGIAPGSTVKWEERDGEIFVRSVTTYTSEDIRRALFPTPPRRRSLRELKEAVGDYLADKHARG